MLGDIEGPLESLIQARAGMPVLQREVIGLFKLAKYFCFPEHHGIQAASDFEEMMYALRFAQRVDLIGQRVAVIVAIQQKLFDLGGSAPCFEFGGNVNLHAVAGREDHPFFGYAGIAQQLKRRRHSRFSESKSLPHGDRRRMMAKAEYENGHARKIRPSIAAPQSRGLSWVVNWRQQIAPPKS